MVAPVAKPSVVLLALAAGLIVTAHCELATDQPSELEQTRSVGQLFDAPNASATNVPSPAELWQRLRADECKISIALLDNHYSIDVVSHRVLELELRLEKLIRVVDGAPFVCVLWSVK